MSNSIDRQQPPADPETPRRREILSKLGVGAVGAAMGVPVLMSIRSLVPNALYEKPRRFKAGGAVCTHLGCTVQLARNEGASPQERFEFQCPCHGSKFRGDGTNVAGPAPRPLDYFKLELAPDDGQLVVDLSQVADKGWRFTV
jgi:menaquinol-cytochrome c reductase iron-sulfur subunit